MALVVKDRVKETSTSTGTGAFTLAGAVDSFQTFASALTNGDTTYYAIIDPGTGEFEVGLGTFNATANTISRDTVLETSNGASLINFQAGEKEVFITYPADKAVYLDATGKVAPTTALMNTVKANDGAGSGVDADLLDGLHGSDFVLKAGDTISGNLTITGDLTVTGTTVTVNATELAIADNMIYMNEGSVVTNPDLGWSGNYNDGTYAHAGFFRDATDGRFKAYDGYTPEPDASPYIDTSHASFSLADIEANTFHGNLSGNASTATKLATARTITLGGDLTGNVTFDGSANVTLSAAVLDDSHNHVISNVDGLQAALDAKADDTTTISAGTGLTGGGDLSVNRTLALDTAYTDGRYVNATGDSMSGNLTFGDNNKAIFGAGSDLQIYHDGSHSYIKDVGTGNIVINGGDFRVNSADNTTNMITANSGGAVGLFYAGSTKLATTSTGVDVTGSITVSGTVDGVDVAAFKTSYDSHNHDDRYYTESEINTKLTDGSVTKFNPSSTDTFTGTYPVLWHDDNVTPYTSTWFTINGATDTLNVPNINLSGNVTVGGTVDGRDVAADGTKLDGIEAGATADQTASEILAAVKTVDGSGSGLDADLLDGIQSGSFLRSDANDTATGIISFTNSSDYQIELNGNGTSYAGIKWTDVTTSDYMWFNGSTGTFAIGGGGSAVSGKKLHVDGGLSVGSSADATAAPTDGIYSQGDIKVGTNTVFHDGYHPNADKLTTARSIALTGDVSGSANFDGSANISITATVADDSHNHVISNVDGLQTALDGKASTSHNHTLDSLSNTTITSNTSGEILKWNGSAWVNNTLAEAGIQPAGSYLTGNQTITLSGDLTGSGTTSINAQLAANVVGANELNVTGNGTTSQYLRSDGDGSFTWATPPDTNTTYSAGSGIGLSGTTFSVAGGTGLTQDASGLSLSAAMSPFTATELSNAVNLDTLVGGQAGFYYQTANADTSGNNYPSGEAGSLIVQKSAGNATQLYQTYNTDAKLFVRSNYNTGWGSWQRVFADNYHPNADKLTTARNIALTGAVTGNANFDGSGNISIATTATSDPTLTINGDASGSATFTNLGNATLTLTIADDSHNHIIANVDGLQAALDGKASTSHNHTLDSLSNTTITSNTAGEILKWNGTAWINNTLAEAGIQPAGSYLTGNQTITLSGDLTGSGTTSINAQIAANAVGANELNVTGNGTTSQYLRSDGDGSFTWATPTPPTTHDAVGTYAFAYVNYYTGIAFGTTLAGSSLQLAGVEGDPYYAVPSLTGAYRDSGSSSTVVGYVGGPTLSGTWRCMGVSAPRSTATRGMTLWVRIS